MKGEKTVVTNGKTTRDRKAFAIFHIDMNNSVKTREGEFKAKLQTRIHRKENEVTDTRKDIYLKNVHYMYVYNQNLG